MNSKLRIVDAGNVVVPAYLTLLHRGYVVRCERNGNDTSESWVAENDTNELVAQDPLTLLGLATIVETRGRNWMASDDQIDDFLQRFGGKIAE